MGKIVTYKKPSVVNPVSVTLVIVAVVLGYLGYVFFPVYVRRAEAYRVLEESGSQFSGSRARYMAVPAEREALHGKMRAQLQQVGVNDPKWKTWLEVKSATDVQFGVRYHDTIHWPFDVREPYVKENTIVYDLKMLPN